MNNEIKTWQDRMSESGKRECASLAIDCMEAEITELRARIESLAADAERYQWLRHGDNDELVIQHGPVAPDYHWLPRKERLDEMIDAHRVKEKA